MDPPIEIHCNINLYKFSLIMVIKGRSPHVKYADPKTQIVIIINCIGMVNILSMAKLL